MVWMPGFLNGRTMTHTCPTQAVSSCLVTCELLQKLIECVCTAPACLSLANQGKLKSWAWKLQPLGELASHLESVYRASQNLDDKGVMPTGGGKLFLVNVSLWMQKPTYKLFLQELVMIESYRGPGCESKACLPLLSNSVCVCTKCRPRVFTVDKAIFRQALVAA